MVKSVRLMFATLVAAFLAAAAFVPVHAASVPVGSSLAIDAASKADVQQVYHHRRYYHRRAYYGRPVYRHRVYHRRVVHRRPVYRHRYVHYRPAYRPRYVRPVYYHPARPAYNRCVVRPRVVWTHYGYVQRYVRVCRW